MVIGLLTLTSIPTVTGVSFGVSEQRKSNQRKEDARRMVKFNIESVYLDFLNPSDRSIPSFTALAFYIEYPEPDETKHLERGLGLPTYVSANPPLLNWIYADKDTYELKYGNRTQSVTHIVGPWDWTEDEKVILLEEKNAFFAVEEEEGQWALYFDREGDELARVLEEREMLDNAFVPVTLMRKVVEEPPPPPSQSQSQSQGQGQGQGQAGGSEQK
ncbi:hypothetical protein N7532_006967 [Penicillium argentinense]|uniref:Uncharacterized protein n=1 Tax=Penicillium argentinense TaxID=1131581 RepID=A0A9W9FGZ2_9EURO|nr:uncharacterized protein N7532_006967 [Penicillium argentinense]KAJ5099966.1 hypothetical protein N7532_006967 [Penicillium argentinense]